MNRKSRAWNGKYFKLERPHKQLIYKATERFQARNPQLQFSTIIDMALTAFFAEHHPDFKTMLEADQLNADLDFSGLHDSEVANDNDKRTRG